MFQYVPLKDMLSTHSTSSANSIMGSMRIRVKDTDDVGQVLVLDARVIHSHSAGISTWLGRFLSGFHYEGECKCK